jgi:vesicular inhibitory amino acid transporter
LLVRVVEDKDKIPHVQHSKQHFFSFFTAFGTIVFAFGGHPAFPTFQADMKNKADFKWAVLLGYMSKYTVYINIYVNVYPFSYICMWK